MTVLINASNTSGLTFTSDTSGSISFQSNSTSVANITSVGITTSQSISSANTFGFKNRIINGGMVIDQRNSGGSITPTSNTFSVDRWSALIGSVASKMSFQQSSTAPTGFTKSLLMTTVSAYAPTGTDYFGTQQPIEGYNVADFNFGTANAKTFTLSFWVKSSLTGTFGGAFGNDAYNRSYPFIYTISAANTWEQKSITVAGDTSGTWTTDNSAGLRVYFSFGAGSTYVGTPNTWASGFYFSGTGATNVVATAGATLSISGVQLEVGSQATSFDVRNYGVELSMCERYYEVLYNDSATVGVWGNIQGGNLTGRGDWYYNTEKRTQPTVALASGASWQSNTPTIFPGISKCHFYSASGGFYSSNTANTASLTAAAEL